MISAPKNVWLPYTQLKPGARLRLFCFPHAGGAASIYRNWADDLPPEIEVCPIQLPGREGRFREAPFTRLAPLVDALTPALLPHLDTPFALFGHSLGALIGFELARRLQRQHGAKPVRLFVSGHNAPQIPDSEPPIHHLPEPQFVDALRQLNGTLEEVLQHAELMELLLPVLRADFTAAETYSYTAGEALECPISVFGGLDDRQTSYEGLEAWRDQTRRECKVHIVPGDHFFLNGSRALLLRAIAQDLATGM
jgi:medium-chain acyl-[acyl-carrier-protein] hydrolase